MIYIYEKFNLTFLKLLNRMWCFTNILFTKSFLITKKFATVENSTHQFCPQTDVASCCSSICLHRLKATFITNKMLMTMNLELTDSDVMNSMRSIQFPNIVPNHKTTIPNRNWTIICNKNYTQNRRHRNQTKIYYWF